MQDMNEQLLTLPEAARLLKVHPRTLSRWARQGSIALVRLPMGRPRIALSEVNRIMAGEPPEAQTTRQE